MLHKTSLLLGSLLVGMAGVDPTPAMGDNGRVGAPGGAA
ncbi:hypothetical protein CCL24_11630, partial [Pseudomonas congelans]